MAHIVALQKQYHQTGDRERHYLPDGDEYVSEVTCEDQVFLHATQGFDEADRTLDGYVVLPPSTGDEDQRGWHEPEGWRFASQEWPDDEGGGLCCQGGQVYEDQDETPRFVLVLVP